MDSDRPKGPTFTDQDKDALTGCIEADQAPDKSNMSVDTIILFCSDKPSGVFEEQIIGALSTMTDADRSRVKTALRGKINARDFDQAIKDYRKRNGILRIARSGDDNRPRLTDRIESCPLDATLPPGWNISAQEGVIELVTKGDPPMQVPEKRFPVPIVLTAILEPLDNQDDTYSYEVAWLSGKRWRRMSMDGAGLFDRARIINLANSGAPVDSENNKWLVKWLGVLRDGREIPSKQVVARCGWHGQNRFVWGKQIEETNVSVDQIAEISENAQLDNVNDEANTQDENLCPNNNQPSEYAVDWSHRVHGGEKEMVEGLCAKGKFDKQREFLIEICKRFPLAAFLVGASCAAPVLRLLRDSSRLDVSGFSVEVVSDESGIGKTTGNVIASSIWGQPSKLIRYCNRTSNVGWEAWRHVFSDLPIFAEEAQLLKPEDREKIVYDQSQGMGKERGNRDGSLRVTKRFYNVAMVSSEESLNGLNAREGANTRLISLPPMFPKKDPKYAIESERIQQQCNAHYGHAGHAYVRYLLEKIQPEILQKFDEIENALRQSIPEDIPAEIQSIAFRMSSRVAACGLGLWLLMDALQFDTADSGKIFDQAMGVTWKLVLRATDAMPIWKKALVVVQSWAAENRNKIAGMEPVTGSQMYGSKRIPDTYIGKVVDVKSAGKCVCFYANAFNDAIRKHLDKDPMEIQKAFIREKISIPDKQGHATRYDYVGGKRGVFIPLEIVFPTGEEVGAEDA